MCRKRGGWACFALALHLYIIPAIADRGIVALTGCAVGKCVVWGKGDPKYLNVKEETRALWGSLRVKLSWEKGKKALSEVYEVDIPHTVLIRVLLSRL